MIKRFFSSWKFTTFTLELRKILTYRADFWVNFIGSTSISFILAYCLWSSVYESQNTQVIRGLGLQDIILYYLLAPQILRIQQGSGIGNIAKEIYEGSLTKFILYPVSFYTYKIIVYLAHSSFYILQLFLILALYKLYFLNESVLELTVLKVILLIISLYLCSLLYFFMSSLCELIAFWADNIWSLNVIIRFSTAFLGGALIPLTFFPEWSQTALSYTPFPYLIDFPISIVMQKTSLMKFLSNSFIILVWTLLFSFLSRLLWRKGQYKYTGVGI